MPARKAAPRKAKLHANPDAAPGRGLTGAIGGILRAPQNVVGQLSGTSRTVGQLSSLDAGQTLVSIAALIDRCNALLDRFDERGGIDRLLDILDTLEPITGRLEPVMNRADPLLDRAGPLLDQLEDVPKNVHEIHDAVLDMHGQMVSVIQGVGQAMDGLDRLPLGARIRRRLERPETEKPPAKRRRG